MENEKRKCLSYIEKKKILELYKNGTSREEIQKQFGIATSTFALIKKNEQEILRMAEDSELQKKKRRRFADDPSLDDAVYKWYCEKRSKGESISGPLIQEQARILNKKLGSPADFKASSGWLSRFKQRHGIRQESMKGEKLSSNNKEASNEFQPLLEGQTESDVFVHDDTYNFVKTEPCCTYTPLKMLDSPEETKVFDQQENEEDRILNFVSTNSICDPWTDYEDNSPEVDTLTEENIKEEKYSTALEMYRQMQNCYEWLQTQEECEMLLLIKFNEIIEFVKKELTFK